MMSQLQSQRSRKKQLELKLQGSSYATQTKSHAPKPLIPKSNAPIKKQKQPTKKSKAKPVTISSQIPTSTYSTMNWVLQNQKPGNLNAVAGQVRPLKLNNSIPTVGLARTKRFTPKNLIQLHRDVHTTELSFENPVPLPVLSHHNNNGWRNHFGPQSSSSSIASSCFSRKGQGDECRMRPDPERLNSEPEIPRQRYITDQLKAQIIAAVREEVLMERRIEAQIEAEAEKRAQNKSKQRVPENTNKLTKSKPTPAPKRSTKKSKSKTAKAKKM